MNDSPSSAMDHRVDFVIGGVQKGGTTALDRLLRRHPDVAMASVKEPKWFDDDRRFAHGPPAPSGYHALFGHPQGARVRGEATPSYCWWPPAAQRIRDYSPAMKWILLFRDPVSRAYSQWNMRRTDGSAQVSFARAVDEEIRRGAEVPVRNNVASSYPSRGFGGDDFGGTIFDENVMQEAGFFNRTTTDEIVALIRDSGFTPAQRTTLYEVVREFQAETAASATA